MKFKGYFIRTNDSMGCVVSDAEDTLKAISRTVFDAIYQSPWKEEDITVLQIRDLETDELLFARCVETAKENFKEYLGI